MCCVLVFPLLYVCLRDLFADVMSINFHCVMCAIRDNIYFISYNRGVIPSYAYKIQLRIIG